VFTVLQFCLGAGSLLLNVIFVVLFRMGIEGILLSNLITLLIAFGFYLLFLGRIGKEYHFRSDWKEIRNTIASGIIFVPGMLAFWGMNSVSRWVLLDVSDLREVGFYSMALRFSSLLEPLVIQPFLNAYNPRLFRSFAEGDYRHLKGRTVALILLAGVLVGPLLAVVARWMVDAAYHPAIVLIPVLVIAAAFSLIAQTAILLIVFRRKVHLSLLAMLTGFAVSVLANYFLAIRYGGIGAACGTAIGNLAWMSIVVFLRRREERIAAIGI
jgi:O-antigen/teichoic acid export membrane protein